ncbi:MAG: protein BatD [bacterium]|nr:protein BatD [bacterium]
MVATGILSALTIILAAAGPKVVVEVDNVAIEVDKPFMIGVQASGTQVGDPILPQVDGLIIDPSPRRQEDRYTIVNSKMTQIRGRGYVATITKPGPLTIPPFRVKIDGKMVESEPVTVRVGEAAALQAPRPEVSDRPSVPAAEPGEGYETPGPSPAGEDFTLNDAVFMTTEIDKREVYQGEPVVMTLKLWAYEGVSISERPFTAEFPSTEGFYTIPQTPQEIDAEVRERNGWRFRIYRQRQMLYPLQTGTIAIGGWNWTGVVTAKTDRGYERRRVSRSAPGLEVLVKPLLERPATFSGAVGAFEFAAELTETKVIQGAPTKLLVRVTGQGNPNAIGEPTLPEIPDAYVGPAEKETQSHPTRDPAALTIERSFTYAITPVKEGILTIPALEFCYFDPRADSYVTKKAGPFSLEVLATPELQSRQVMDAGLGMEPEAVDVVGQDIMPPITHPGPLKRGNGFAFLPILLNIVLPPALYGALALVMARRRRFAGDTSFARSHRARARARKRLAAAAGAEEPADELYRAMTGFVADKFDVAEGGITSADAERLLTGGGASPDDTDNFLKVLRKCERARYGSEPLSPNEANALMHGAAGCIDGLDASLAAGRARKEAP